MNARQKAKKLKKEKITLKSDNDLMHRIIADSPMMSELYDAYNKPLNVIHTTMQFKEYRTKRAIPCYMRDLDGIIDHTKQALAEDLFNIIKENIIYEFDDIDMRASTITASVFIGKSNIERR